MESNHQTAGKENKF